MIRVLIADDHDLFRAGIKHILKDVSGMLVVGEVNDGVQAIEAAKRLKPDVLLMDLKMPHMSGFMAAQSILAPQPRAVKLLVVTSMANPCYSERLLQMGARGYLTKDALPTDLVRAIRQVNQGETYLTKAVAEKIADPIIQSSAVPLSELSDREFHIMLLMAHNKTAEQMAQEMRLSGAEVANYQQELIGKFQLSNTNELMHQAKTSGLVDNAV